MGSVAADSGIGRRLRARRRHMQLTLTDVAARAGISVGQLSMIETGHRQPSLGSLLALQRALRLGPELLGAASPDAAGSLCQRLGALVAGGPQPWDALPVRLGTTVEEVRIAVDELAHRLAGSGIALRDSGRVLRLAPEPMTMARPASRRQAMELTEEQAEILSVVIAMGAATRAKLEGALIPTGSAPGRRSRLGADLTVLAGSGHLEVEQDPSRPALLHYRPGTALLAGGSLTELRARMGLPDEDWDGSAVPANEVPSQESAAAS